MKVSEAAAFLKNAKGKVGIFFDDDTDGTCGAALVTAYLKLQDVKPQLFTGVLNQATFSAFASEELDHWIFIDFAIDQYSDWIAPLKGKSVLIIDHHPVINDLNKDGFLYLNPRIDQPDLYYCSTHIAFDVAHAAGLENMEWLSRIGQVGDHEIKGTEEEMQATSMIDAVVSMKERDDLIKVANFLSEAESLKQFLTEQRYLKLRDEFEEEMERQVMLYELEATGDVTFFQVKSRFSLISMLSTRLFDMYPNRVIILYKQKPEGWSISGRGNRIDLGKAFREATEGIGQGGGHPVAAGAYVTDFERFKGRLLQKLKRK